MLVAFNHGKYLEYGLDIFGVWLHWIFVGKYLEREGEREWPRGREERKSW